MSNKLTFKDVKANVKLSTDVQAEVYGVLVRGIKQNANNTCEKDGGIGWAVARRRPARHLSDPSSSNLPYKETITYSGGWGVQRFGAVVNAACMVKASLIWGISTLGIVEYMNAGGVIKNKGEDQLRCTEYTFGAFIHPGAIITELAGWRYYVALYGLSGVDNSAAACTIAGIVGKHDYQAGVSPPAE